MSDRDTLAKLITRWAENDDTESCDELAGWLLAHGVRPPSREIATAAELDALPIGSVVLDEDGDPWARRENGWCCAYIYSPELPTGGLFINSASLTVVNVPTEEGDRGV